MDRWRFGTGDQNRFDVIDGEVRGSVGPDTQDRGVQVGVAPESEDGLGGVGGDLGLVEPEPLDQAVPPALGGTRPPQEAPTQRAESVG